MSCVPALSAVLSGQKSNSAMDFYQPRFKDGRLVVLPMQFLAYKLNFLWPLREEATWLQHLLRLAAVAVSLGCYVGTVTAEFTFLSENVGNVPAISECLTTTFMGLQYTVRIFLLSTQQQQLRTLVQRFYRDIHFTAADNNQLYAQVQRITRFADFFTKLYYTPMVIIFAMFLVDVISQGITSTTKPYIYRMSFRWYEAQTPAAYVLTSLYTSWLALSCVTLMSATDLLLSIVLCHTSYRYKELRGQLTNMLDAARVDAKRAAAGGSNNITAAATLQRHFRKRLYAVFRQQQRLNSFVDVAKSHFTHQIFFCMSFGVLLLCNVMFQFQRTTIGFGWVKYIVWLISQIAQFILIGHFGQMLMDESAGLQHSFYMCQWEELLPYGSHYANKMLMTDITFAIAHAQKAIVFDGMKMFPLSHNIVGSALRSAMSYFMFLNTMNDANKSK